jgi:hypothetical protein
MIKFSQLNNLLTLFLYPVSRRNQGPRPLARLESVLGFFDWDMLFDFERVVIDQWFRASGLNSECR